MFKYKGIKNGVTHPTTEEVIITNSATIQIGDMVRSYVDGFVEVAVAARPILGVVVGVVDSKGLPVDPDSGTLDTYTVASDNETVAQKRAVVITDRNALFSADVDGTIGTTNTSNLRGANLDLTDENSVAETSAVRNASAQLYSYGTDPDDSTNLLVSIMESEKDGANAYS